MIITDRYEHFVSKEDREFSEFLMKQAEEFKKNSENIKRKMRAKLGYPLMTTFLDEL